MKKEPCGPERLRFGASFTSHQKENMENPNPIDAINCLHHAVAHAQAGDFLRAAQEAGEAVQRLITCEERDKSNLSESLRKSIGLPTR